MDTKNVENVAIEETKVVKVAEEEKNNQNMVSRIKVVRTHLPYSKLMDFVDTTVRLSFGTDGNYHKYLKDYVETLTILEVYTDYSGEVDFESVMDVRFSHVWDSVIIPAVHKDYEIFTNYVEDEIATITAPFAGITNTLASVKNTADKLFEVLNALNINELSGLDVSALADALENLPSNDKAEQAEQTA